MKKILNLIKRDPRLSPYKNAIDGRYEYALEKEKEIGRASCRERVASPV